MDNFQITRRALFVLTGAGIVLVAIGVIAGWVFHITSLTAVFPGYPSMKFNTAVAFLLAGLATILVDHSNKKQVKYIYLGLSAGVYFIGLFTLIEYIFDINLHLDGLFFYDQSVSTEMTPYPGRMAGSSALSFCITGAAYMGLLSRSLKIRHWAQYGLHLVTVLSGIALMGYLFNLTTVYKIAHFTSMAVHTSVIFLVLSVTLSFYNSDMGITGLFTGKGMGNQMARKLFPVMTLTTLFLGFVRVTLFKYHIVSIEFGIAMATSTFLMVTLLLVYVVARQINKLEAGKNETDLANYKLSIDIAAEQKGRNETAEANKRNLLFVQQSPSAVAMFDTEMRYLAVSEQWIKDYQLEGKEIIGRSQYDVFPVIDESRKAVHRRCLNGATDKCDEYFFLRADGTVQWISWDIRPWYKAEGEIGGLLIHTADISHYKNNEALLKEATDSLADAQHIAHVGSWVWNLPAKELRWSDKLYNIYGLEPGSVPASTELFNKVLHPGDRERIDAEMRAAIKGPDHIKTEFRVVRKDGSVRFVDARGKVYRDSSGRAVKVIGTIADLTERKKLERNLMVSEKEFRSAFESSALGMSQVSLQGKLLRVNKELCKILGYTETELIGKSFAELTYPDDLNESMLALEGMKKGENDKYQVEKRFIHKQGNIVWVELTVSIVFDESQHPLYLVSQIKDTTERKKLERELMLSEKEFRSAFEDSAVGMTFVSLEFNWLRINDNFCRMVGYTRQELMKITFADITHPEDAGRDRAQLKRLVDKEIERYQVEKRYIHKNGSIIWGLITVSVIFDERESPLYFITQIADITLRKKLERDLLISEKEFRSLFENSAVGMAQVSREGRFMKVNPELCKMIGYTEAELMQTTFTQITHSDDLAVNVINLKRLFNGETTRYQAEKRYIHKNGNIVWVGLTVSVVFDDKQAPVYLVSQMKDITENKQAEETRKHVAILEARNREMEEFAFIASHDLQEPLRTVTGFVELLKMDYGLQIPEGAKEYVEFISGSTKRMSELIKGLLDFSRLGKEKTFAQVNCNETLNAVVQDLGEAVKESQAVITVEQMPVIQGLPTEMKQLFQNLLSNAIKFRRPGVQPRIHVSVISLPGFWQFAVTDNGVGIQSRHYHKIFLLFQRLHNRGAYPGTGIGLSYCKKIVELHQGKIWVESVPGEGSTFLFTIAKLNA